MPPKTRGIERNVIAAPPTQTDVEAAALVAERARSTAPSEISKLTVSMTPWGVDGLDTLVYALKKSGYRVSASAVIEAAILELLDTFNREATVDSVAAIVRKHIGENAARRRVGAP